jgi:hypothetical protein
MEKIDCPLFQGRDRGPSFAMSISGALLPIIACPKTLLLRPLSEVSRPFATA